MTILYERSFLIKRGSNMEVEFILKKFDKEFGNKFKTESKILEEASKAPYLVSPILSSKGKRALGVLVAEDEEDIFKAVKICDQYRIPLVARGAGTSTIGQVLPIKEVVVLDINKIDKEIELDNNWVKVSPGVKVKNTLDFLRKRGKELRVYPSSFYISTIGGYIAGGDVGIGSFQYGYHFDNNGIRELKVIGSTGKYVIRGDETLGIAQAAGTNGIITEAEVSVVDYEDWKDQIIPLNSVGEVVSTLSRLKEYRDKIRRITIEDVDTLSLVSRNRINDIGKWNLIVSSTRSFGQEVNLRFLDELAFAAIYVTMSKLTGFKDYFYEVRLLSLDSFNNVVSQIKRALNSKVLIHGDVMTLNNDIIVYTVFISEKSNFDIIDLIMRKEGIPFEIHSIEVNDRVDSSYRLELMKKYKRILDPHDIFNPGKLRL